MKNRYLFSVKIFLIVAASLLITSISTLASTRMPDFILTNALGGKEVSSTEFNGKALLVTFFATWCPPCRQEVGELKQLQKNFADEGFSVLGLSVDQGGVAAVADFAQKFGINYPVLMATMQTGQDFGGIFGIPTAFLINKEGSVVKRYQGFIDYQVFEKDIRSLLK